MVKSKAIGASRKIAYVLGAGFSYGSNHVAPVGNHVIRMPLQLTLFEELCKFHYRKIKELDSIARVIRKYFSPSTVRASRGAGARRHADLFGLSVEEVVTFFDEMLQNESSDEYQDIRFAATKLQQLIVELISYCSVNGHPGRNKLLQEFVNRLVKTDVVVSFNWDTILDRVLMNKKGWHPSWGYGRTVSDHLSFSSESSSDKPKKYIRLLKLHGSINWLASEVEDEFNGVITAGWCPPKGAEKNVVMMPPKMIKSEILNRSEGANSRSTNNFVPRNFYPDLWAEAEDQLSNCRRIVFIGYSFPPADFALGNMLRRAISRLRIKRGFFHAVDIVDPKAAVLAERFKSSFGIEVDIRNQFLSLENYLSTTRAD